jgi:hypothetical protein
MLGPRQNLAGNVASFRKLVEMMVDEDMKTIAGMSSKNSRPLKSKNTMIDENWISTVFQKL